MLTSSGWSEQQILEVTQNPGLSGELLLEVLIARIMRGHVPSCWAAERAASLFVYDDKLDEALHPLRRRIP